jgi:hypothetical protein
MRYELTRWELPLAWYVVVVVSNSLWTAPAAIGLAAFGWYGRRRLGRLRWLAFAASALLAIPFVIAVVLAVIER